MRNSTLLREVTALPPVRLEAGRREARSRGRPVLVSTTREIVPCTDPLAVVLASRRAAEPWFAFEQPERHHSALAGLGAACELRSSGARRFSELAAAWQTLAADALADQPAEAPGAGLVAVGGAAFDGAGAMSPAWAGFDAASLHVPAVCLARHGERTWLTVNLVISPDDILAERQAELERRLTELVHRPLPMLDPSPAVSPVVRSVMPPSHYEEAVARAVTRIRNGEMEKVVLGREVEVRAAAPFDPAAVLGVLRQAFPGCFVFAVGRGETTFLGASPELLVRREGSRASTVALAGSARRSADPAVDDHLAERLLRSDKERAENAIVARRITRSLAPLSVWVTAAPEPSVIKVANIQHLAAPIRAQLARPLGAVELAGLLHPTPAVGGEPWSVAESVIPALEGFDRGWYAGPVGWVDSAGDGEFCVALRCALLRESTARLYAGAGIVAESDPAAELAETEVKLGALLPILSG